MGISKSDGVGAGMVERCREDPPTCWNEVQLHLRSEHCLLERRVTRSDQRLARIAWPAWTVTVCAGQLYLVQRWRHARHCTGQRSSRSWESTQSKAAVWRRDTDQFMAREAQRAEQCLREMKQR